MDEEAAPARGDPRVPGYAGESRQCRLCATREESLSHSSDTLILRGVFLGAVKPTGRSRCRAGGQWFAAVLAAGGTPEPREYFLPQAHTEKVKRQKRRAEGLERDATGIPWVLRERVITRSDDAGRPGWSKRVVSDPWFPWSLVARSALRPPTGSP